MSVNDLRKDKNHITKRNAGACRPTAARWRGPDVIFFSYLSIVLCLDYPILPYALSFYWHFVLRALHFIFRFFRGSTPPWHHTGIDVLYIYIYRCTVYGFQTPFHSSWFPNAPLPVSPGRTTSFGSARSVGVRPAPTPCTPTCEAVTTSRDVAVTMVIQ